MARFIRTPGLNTLCTPAYLYLMLSIVMLILTGIMMNTDSMKRFCNGYCSNMQIVSFFIIKFVFVIFWTWILNVLCRGGAGWLSWLLVLFPFIMIFAVLLTAFGTALVTGGSYISYYGQRFVQPNDVVHPNVVQPPAPHDVANNTAMLVNGMPAPKM